MRPKLNPHPFLTFLRLSTYLSEKTHWFSLSRPSWRRLCARLLKQNKMPSDKQAEEANQFMRTPGSLFSCRVGRAYVSYTQNRGWGWTCVFFVATFDVTRGGEGGQDDENVLGDGDLCNAGHRRLWWSIHTYIIWALTYVHRFSREVEAYQQLCPKHTQYWQKEKSYF